MADLAAERVDKSTGRTSAKRLLPIARVAGYEGSARNFRRLVAEEKALWRSTNHRGRRPAVWEPGECLVIDWAQVAPGFVSVLRGAGVLGVAVGMVRHRATRLDHASADRGCTGRDRRGLGAGAGRPGPCAYANICERCPNFRADTSSRGLRRPGPVSRCLRAEQPG